MRSFLKSFQYAIRGIGFNLAYERNFRIHCFAALTVFLLSLFYDFSSVEWSILIIQITLVIGAESLNSAIEQNANKITRERSRRIRHAKDSAAAAVLIISVGALFVAWHLFWDIAVFKEIVAFFSVGLRPLLVVLYAAVILFFVFCKKTYKKDK